MATIIKNNGDNSWVLADTSPQITIPSESNADLEANLSIAAISLSTQLIADIANEDLSLTVNDGSRDLTVAEALRHIFQRAMPAAVDDEDRLRVQVEPRKTGSGLVIVTHNFCDPTTWYSQSERETDEELSDSGDGLTFNSDYDNWIDLSHGKIYREDLISSSYLPVIKVNGTTKTERAYGETSGGDFTINYATGDVTFFSSQSGNTVTASYSRANGSRFTVAPAANKRLWLEYSEVQFAKNVEMKASIHFQPWCYNPADLPNKMAADNPTTYKNLDNFIEEANGCYPVITAMGGSTRGFVQDRITFPFNYMTVKELHSCMGVEIRVWIEGDVPFEGEYGTATFYCTSFDDAC